MVLVLCLMVVICLVCWVVHTVVLVRFEVVGFCLTCGFVWVFKLAGVFVYCWFACCGCTDWLRVLFAPVVGFGCLLCLMTFMVLSG